MKRLKLPPAAEGEIRVEINASTNCSWFFRYYNESDHFYEAISEEEKDHVVFLGQVYKLKNAENDFNMVVTNPAENKQDYVFSLNWRHYINGQLFATVDRARYSGELESRESNEVKLHIIFEK